MKEEVIKELTVKNEPESEGLNLMTLMACSHYSDVDIKKYRFITVKYDKSMLSHIPLWKLIWGFDIWIHKVPVLKCLILFNVIIAIVL